MLRIVKKSAPPDTPKRRSAARLSVTRESDMLQCVRCEGRELIETVTGVRLVNGKPKGGARTYVCATCHRNGERVVVA